MRVSSLRLTTLTILFAVLAGCGGSAAHPKPNPYPEARKTAGQILADARGASEEATAVHVTGHIHEAGKTILMDVRIAASSGAYGTFTFEGGRLSIVATRSTEYFKAPAAFYMREGAPRQAAQLLDNRWVKLPATSAEARSLSHFTSVTNLFSSLFKSTGAVVKLPGIHMIHGVPTVVLMDDTGARMYVAAKGSPVPVEVSSPHGETWGWIRFQDYNKPVQLLVPKHVFSGGQ